MKKIILCADDYGQNPSISQAIINLIEKKRLSATSCMTNSVYWPEHAKWLQPYKGKVDIGLHVNLTEGVSLSGHLKMMPLSGLLMRAYLHQLNQPAIEAEVNAQLDKFVEEMQQLPDFIDGHQHVHQFPVIRDVILKIYEKRLKVNGTYIRSVNDNKILLRFSDAYLKKIIIQLTGAFAFKAKLKVMNIPHNSSFSGIYDFVNGKHYPEKFPEFLKKIQDNGLIMCHPGLLSDDESDPIYSAREFEYRYFMSEKFLKDCSTHQVIISRM